MGCWFQGLLRALLVVGLMVAGAAPALAQDPATYDIDIAAKPLPEALADLAAVTGLQVVYSGAQPFDRSTQAVKGKLTAPEALDRMLAGTGFTYRFVGDNAITLAEAPAPQGQTQDTVTALPPVVVTGERSTRTLAETQSSVTVITAEDLEKRPDLDNSNDVLDHLPNVTNTGTDSFAPAIRGLDGTGPTNGGNAFLAGVRPRLNIQVDGRATTYNEVVFGGVSMWDVEQVEMFNGAQSTLQGRNAIAGSMAIKTKDPTWDYEVGGRLIGGNDHLFGQSAMVSGPIVDDQLAFRIALDHESSESFVKGMEDYPGVTDPSDFHSQTFRGKLLFQPEAIEGFKALLTVSYTKEVGPQTESLGRPYREQNTSFPAMTTFAPSTTAGILETSYEVNENFTLENTTSLADLNVWREAEPSGGNMKINGTEVATEQRLRFKGLEGRLAGVTGIYFYRETQHDKIDIGPAEFDDKTTTAAGFGEATLSTFEGVIDFTLGGRVEWERRYRKDTDGDLFPVDLDEEQVVFLPKAGVAWHANDDLTFGVVGYRGYNGGGAGINFDFPFTSYTYKPEYVWTGEIYTRAELDGDRLQLTGNIFYSDYKDIQLPVLLTPVSTIVINAPHARTFGAEIGAKWLPMPELELFGNIGLLKTEILDGGRADDIEGNDLPRSPAFTLDVGGNYTHWTGIEFGANLRYSESYYSDIVNDGRAKIDPYWSANAQLGYRIDGVHVFAFVDNIFDATEPVMKFTSDDSAVIQHPRTFGAGLELQF
jgi:outer membrane receptor protein involved in Fe transport